MSRAKSELERIQEANRLAEKYVNQLPPEVVEQCGYANLVSDLAREYLMAGLPSEELRDQLIENTLAEDPDDQT